MRLSLLIYILLSGMSLSAQQPLFIPDTLSGPNISLTLKSDSVQFLAGQKTQTNGFNNYKYLGPTLILKKGSTINLSVNNQLTDTTTMHWHGLHVAPYNDGGPHTMILPGATWTPGFVVMNDAATYFYHPHMGMKTAAQVMLGAMGLIIVRDSTEATFNLPRRYGLDDFPIIVQSQELDTLNQIDPRGMVDSVLMVNGTMNPYLDVPAQVVRMRLLNGAQERAFNFGFTGNKSFYVIATDGGLLDSAISTTRIRLGPGERAEILLDLSAMNGQSLYLMSYASEIPIGVQGGPTMPMPPWSPPMNSPLNGIDFNILQLNVGAASVNPVTTVPTTLVPLNPYAASSADSIRTINFTADSAMVMDGPFYFNGNSFDMMRIDYRIPLNNIEIWKLVNETMVAHAFHIHDVQFYILKKNNHGPLSVEKGKKDVVLVEPYDTVYFITKFQDFTDTAIPYMYHCHMLMHEDDGMMGQFLVVPATTSVTKISSSPLVNIYPNPADDIVNIEASNISSTTANISVTDITGKLLLQKEIKAVNKNINTSIDINAFAPGFYILTVKAGVEQKVMKLVKK